MKVGVLTMLKHEFIAFKKNNKAMECHHITSVNQLIDFTADMYVRVNGWQMLSVKVLNVVKAQEELRDLNKTNVIEPLDTFKFKSIVNAQPKNNKAYRLRGTHADWVMQDDPFARLGVVNTQQNNSIMPQHPMMRCDMAMNMKDVSTTFEKAAASFKEFYSVVPSITIKR